MKLSNLILVIVAIFVVAMISSFVAGTLKAKEPGVEYYWTHPEAGTAIHHYVGEQRLISGTDTTSIYIYDIPVGDEVGSYTLNYQFGLTSYFRVAGVDSLYRQGPWSLWSDPWIDDGPPTAPGKPSQTLTLNHK